MTLIGEPTRSNFAEWYQIVPIDSSRLSVKLVKNGTLKMIPGAPHGLCTTHADIVNEELLAFLMKYLVLPITQFPMVKNLSNHS
jgi:non-heme chloroperoxidase